MLVFSCSRLYDVSQMRIPAHFSFFRLLPIIVMKGLFLLRASTLTALSASMVLLFAASALSEETISEEGISEEIIEKASEEKSADVSAQSAEQEADADHMAKDDAEADKQEEAEKLPEKITEEELREMGYEIYSSDAHKHSVLQRPPRIQAHVQEHSFGIIKEKHAQTVMGASMFFGSLVIEWGAIYPWTVRFANHVAAQGDTVTSADAQEALAILLAGLPVGLLQIGGATVACAGASRVYGTYSANIDPMVADVQVWKPYIFGWVGRGVAGFVGMLASFSGSAEMSIVASYIALGGEIAWTTSTVMSLVYSGKRRGEARRRLVVVPLYSPQQGSGLAMRWKF